MKKRKFLSTVLIGALMLSAVPFAAFAEDNEPIPDVLVEDGVTYFDAGSEHFEDSTRLFIQDLLSAKNSNIDDTSTAALWQGHFKKLAGRDGTVIGHAKRVFNGSVWNHFENFRGERQVFIVWHRWSPPSWQRRAC